MWMRVCVWACRICVREWWWRQTICLAESECAWYPLCLGVAAPQMFWLFLALLCFWFPLVCLELEGLQAIHYGTFEEVLVNSPCCAPSIKLSVSFHLSWDHSNKDLLGATDLYEVRWKENPFFFLWGTNWNGWCPTLLKFTISSLYWWGSVCL